MSEPWFHPAAGLAGLLSALQPRDPEMEVSVDVAALCDAARLAGFAEGTARAEAELAPLRRHLAEAAEALEAACRIDPDRLRPLMMALVQKIVEAVLLAELGKGLGVLQPLVEAVLAAAGPLERASLRLHPETLAVLQPHLPHLRVIADASLDRDNIIVEAIDFVIDTSLSARLAQVLETLA